jgi:hypothetical protein
MTQLQRVEVPPNFGVNVFDMNRLKGGKVNEFLSRILNPFSVVSRLQFRAAVDISGISDLIPRRLTVARGALVASAMIGADQVVTICAGEQTFSLKFENAVSCIGFVGDRLLLTGTVLGDIELWYLNLTEGINEAKCVYRFHCGSSLFAVLLGSNDHTFQVILNRGKCMLVFDTVACVSGNTDESATAPVIVDLLQPPPLTDAESFDALIATVSLTSVTVTDTAEHRSVSWDFEGACRSFWAPIIGHLFLVTENGEVVDCAWSDGLVGVSTVLKAIGGKPASVERTGLVVNPQLVDFKEKSFVTVNDNDLSIYSIKTGASGRFPISPIVTEFQIEKQVPIRFNAAEENVVAVKILGNKSCAILVEGPRNKIRAIYVPL